MFNLCTGCKDLLLHLVTHTERQHTNKNVIDTHHCHDTVLQHTRLLCSLASHLAHKKHRTWQSAAFDLQVSLPFLLPLRTQTPVLHELWALLIALMNTNVSHFIFSEARSGSDSPTFRLLVIHVSRRRYLLSEPPHHTPSICCNRSLIRCSLKCTE